MNAQQKSALCSILLTLGSCQDLERRNPIAPPADRLGGVDTSLNVVSWMKYGSDSIVIVSEPVSHGTHWLRIYTPDTLIGDICINDGYEGYFLPGRISNDPGQWSVLQTSSISAMIDALRPSKDMAYCSVVIEEVLREHFDRTLTLTDPSLEDLCLGVSNSTDTLFYSGTKFQFVCFIRETTHGPSSSLVLLRLGTTQGLEPAKDQAPG